MLSVSTKFHSAESAEVNKPKAQVFILLGNYATAAAGASASASGSATDYPATGAVNGDRTELNVGAASGADDDIGQSSWRSTVAPSSVAQTLTVDMGLSRKINRIKLYHLSSHGLKSFKLESSPDNSAWTLIDKTTDQGGAIATAYKVDTVDFTEVTCRYVKLTVSDTFVVADMANVVALEIYRKVDITSRVISVKTNRSRDFQLTNSLAATVSVVVTNVDKFFSPSYVPTSAQTDFFNSELKPSLGLIVKMGYDFTGAPEYSQVFIGTIDSISVKPGIRSAQINARDGMKAVFNKIISTKLQQNKDIGTLVQFMLNKANISSWESSIDTTGIVVDYFFSFDEVILTTIRTLVEAAGDASFYFDENGIANFKSYISSTPLESTSSAQSDFDAGSLTNIDTNSEPGKIKRKWFPLETFDDGELLSNPTWTQHNGNGLWAISAGALNYPARTNVSTASDFGPYNIATPLQQMTGSWEVRMQFASLSSGNTDESGGSAGNGIARSRIYFIAGAYDVTKKVYQSAYFLDISNGSVSVLKTDAGGNETVLATALQANDLNYHSYRIIRNSAGVIKVYFDGSLIITTAADTSITSSINLALTNYGALFIWRPGSSVTQILNFTCGSVNFDDLYYSLSTDGTTAATTAQAVFISAAIDQGALISSEGIFQATVVTPAGTSLAFYTATSADNVTYDAYVAVINGGAIGSVARRYLKCKIVFTTPADGGTNVNFTTPDVSDINLTYNIGTGVGSGGSVKYPTTVSFTFGENLNLDLEQIISDTIGGESSIINYSSVKAQPLILSGTDADVQWQGTVQVPPVAVSPTNPINVNNGDVLTYPVVVSGGMDTSRMSGATPLAAVVTFAGGAVGTYKFTSIHPTRPILQITITNAGTITALQIQGKSFTNNNTLLEKTSSDSNSINAYDERRFEVSNQYIVNSSIAAAIASRLVANFANPTTYVPQIRVRPTYSIQVGDRVLVVDKNLNISQNNIVTGVEHSLSVSMQSGEAYTALKLLTIAT